MCQQAWCSGGKKAAGSQTRLDGHAQDAMSCFMRACFYQFLFYRHAGAEFHRLAGAKGYFHLQISVDAGIIVIEQLQGASASQGCKLLTLSSCWQQFIPQAFKPLMAWRSGQSVPLISDLPDFAIGLAHSQVHNEELDSVEREKFAVLKKNIASHQCLLKDDMVPDGDCGLRAIVENAQRLNLSDPFALKVLAQLKQNGIGDACKLLRLKLCLWLKQNAAREIVPDVTILDWVQLPIDEYILLMQKDKQWLDTPMLSAASAVLGIQIMFFLQPEGVQLLAASGVQEQGKAPVAILARAGKFLYSVHPAPDELESRVASRDALHDACQAVASSQSVHDDAEPEALSESDGEDEEVLLQNSRPKLFEMCAALLHWDPFQNRETDDHLLWCVKLIRHNQKIRQIKLLKSCSGVVR